MKQADHETEDKDVLHTQRPQKCTLVKPPWMKVNKRPFNLHLQQPFSHLLFFLCELLTLLQLTLCGWTGCSM